MTVPAMWVATVTAIRSLTAEVREWVLQPASGIQWKPGQYVTVQIPASGDLPATTRDYSIANTAHPMRLVANQVPNGRGSGYLFALREGDTVTCSGPKGHFVIDDRGLRDYLFVATGTGIAPLRAMIEHLLARHVPRPIRLYWGVRAEPDCYWQEEFAEWQRQHPNFSAVVTLSQPTAAWPGARGYVTEHLALDITSVAALEAYVCGSGAMIADVKAALKQQGLCPVKTEKFY